ncbi:MAG: efflux RND transporter periplasmic adaptor subunit [bacterium]|nr:efflux RND transporter periplasmic adaptor subunit [bacterium]
MKLRHLFISFILIILISFAVYRFIPQQQTKKTDTPTVAVKQGEFVVAINETGVIKALRSQVVTAPQIPRAWGALKITKMVPEGSFIKTGEPLVWFDMTDLDRQVKEQEFRYKQQQANFQKTLESQRLARAKRSLTLQEAKSNWDYAKVQLEEAKKKYEKMQRLAKLELVPLRQVEDTESSFRRAALRAETAEANYLKALESEETAEKVKEIDIQLTEDRSRRYEKDYQELQESLSKTTVFAPTDGLVVYMKNWRRGRVEPIKEGDQISPGNDIVMIPDLRDIIVMTQIDETDRQKVYPGQSVRVKLDAVPDLILYGTITQIGNLAIDRTRAEGAGYVSEEESSGFKVFEVTVKIARPDSRLRPGMTGKVEIILDTVPQAVYIPLDAVVAEQGKQVVYIKKKDGKRERQEVTLGKENGKFVMVTKGLKAGEEIYLPQEEESK